MLLLLIIIFAIGIIIMFRILWVKRKKISTEIKIGLIITIIVFGITEIGSIILYVNDKIEKHIVSEREKSDFKNLNQPYLLPKIKKTSINSIRLFIKNTGNLSANDVVFYIELDSAVLKNFDEPTAIIPGGEIIKNISYVDRGRQIINLKLTLIYKSIIKEEEIGFGYEYKFVMERDGFVDYGYKVIEELKGLTITDLYNLPNERIEESVNEADIGSVLFTIKYMKHSDMKYFFVKTGVRELFWDGPDSILVYRSLRGIGNMIYVEYQPSEFNSNSDNYMFTWDETKTPPDIKIYLNGKLVD